MALAIDRLNSFRRGYTAFALVIINTLLLLIIIEGATRLWDAVAHAGKQAGDPRAQLSYYRSARWGSDYWSEYVRSSAERYEPYVVWRRQPFAGTFINIDSAGMRVVPGRGCPPGAPRIAVFGGSTVWGTGAPDAYTIPAQLQQLLVKGRQPPPCVTNFGESGYVTGQEVIVLLDYLRRAAPIDVAVFYDGVNDVHAAYQSGRADVHQNLAQIAFRFEGRHRSAAHRFEDWLYENSRAYNRLRNAMGGLNPSSTVPRFTPQDSALVDRAVASYLFNVDLIRQLGERYGFRTYFFWQPVIYTSRKELTEEEKGMLAQQDSRAVEFYRQAARSLAMRPDSSVIDLTHVFDERREMIWIDWAHITPEGNAIVAQEIAARIQ